MNHPSAARPGDRLVRLGAGVFTVGLLFVLVAVVPFFFGARNLPTLLMAGAGVLPPLGFALALAGIVRAARRTRPATR